MLNPLGTDADEDSMNRSLFAPLGVAVLGVALVVAYLNVLDGRGAEWIAAAAPALTRPKTTCRARRTAVHSRRARETRS